MMKLNLIKEKDYVKVYKGNNCKIYYGKKYGVFGNNDKNPNELIYLISGKLEVTIEDKIEIIISPSKFEVPEKTFHKLVALTDVIFEVY